ncbi:ABC transporter substrate-binding protein [Pelagimonas varians]|jgi:peptide/nickel transport system substrate-binding protein|uniref:Glutathione-binding protein GsiB n=1 Tax=Pelagimonas varians TaxID=696760 RepID=A0A238KGZ7_9RHOB|nr:ABC transporter substrate-binding protein [Pelagimonas varians]MDB9857496.1 ABC transporter substrate-binding protein [Amylibacter sp.]PYG32279.1 peptide/nickel transport system substrate-binding protein [Pelagimonas varians]SMX42051.1 Glutathione-binding protein GsiB precursor [Pelagimonas varians]|tara:strand:+ start:178 stop:1773 length:1596 start_codon:yes stop_codon:yes gene_type:complete
MNTIKLMLSATALTSVVASAVAAETTFRYGFQGSLGSLDPYSLSETFTLGTLTNVYEGLTRRDENLQIQPGLAESWEIIEPTRWRFNLRQGVKFHNGNDFTAADVVFSANRVRSEGSDLKARIPTDAEFIAVDDHTVDVVLSSANPILHSEWHTWMIVDQEWTVTTDSVQVTTAADTSVTTISQETNGTGPFMIAEHTTGVETNFTANAGWWGWNGKAPNVDRVEFKTIAADATRVAALLSGEMDLVYPVPPQDIGRVESNAATSALVGPELRTIFLGMDQARDVLTYSNVTDANPLQDVRVRQAFYHAIDAVAISARIMRGQATPSALMLAPSLFSGSGAFERLAYDPELSKQLLADAGYPDGFEIQLDCPNDRYVNDEAICQAVAAMMARAGITVNVNAQPKAQFFARVLAAGGYDTSFYLLGWSPSSFDSWNVLTQLHGCRTQNEGTGPFNIGGYCNLKVDELAAQVLVENDAAKRDELIAQAYKMTTDDVAYLPLHQQGLAWGVSEKFSVAQRADNIFRFSLITAAK